MHHAVNAWRSSAAAPGPDYDIVVP